MVKRFDYKVFLNLIRSMFPNWNFFDQTGYHFSLYVKTNLSEDWVLLEFEKKRTWLSLFFNAELNENLAHFSVVEQFARDIQQNTNSPTELVTYKMLTSLLACWLTEKKPVSQSFQFKLVALKENEKIQLYESDKIQMEHL